MICCVVGGCDGIRVRDRDRVGAHVYVACCVCVLRVACVGYPPGPKPNKRALRFTVCLFMRAVNES